MMVPHHGWGGKGRPTPMLRAWGAISHKHFNEDVEQATRRAHKYFPVHLERVLTPRTCAVRHRHHALLPRRVQGSVALSLCTRCGGAEVWRCRGAISHTLIHFIPDSLRESVHRVSRRQCDRSLCPPWRCSQHQHGTGEPCSPPSSNQKPDGRTLGLLRMVGMFALLACLGAVQVPCRGGVGTRHC
jgi:hypothetical protein